MEEKPEEALTALQRLAEWWLKRPLDADEAQVLSRFVASPAATEVEQAIARIQQSLKNSSEGAMRAIEQVRAEAESSLKQLAEARQREEQAVLKTVETAQSLTSLRPASLPATGDGGSSGQRLVIAQIADRLAHLARAEVDACFERKFGPLLHRIEGVLANAAAPGEQGVQPPK